MSETEYHDGGCTCGVVRYRMLRAPLFVHCCHCRSCQTQSGAAFAINAMIEASAFEVLSGETEMIDTPTDSGKGQKVHRCPTCKVAVWSHYAGADEKIHFVRVGTLNAPERCPPDIHIFTKSKQPWVTLPADAAVVPVYYDADEMWSADSLARRDAVFR